MEKRVIGIASIAAIVLVCCAGEETQEPSRGSVGSAIWSDSVASVTVRRVSFIQGWGAAGGPGSNSRHNSSCQVYRTQDLSEEAQDALADIRLVELDLRCSIDGYDYTEIVIENSDGTHQAYRDTGCERLAVEGADAMLPTYALPDGWDDLSPSADCAN